MQTLGDLEAAGREALWERGELSTPDVHEVVGVPRGLAYTTILTVLQRLTRKELVTRRGGGRSHLYAPALTREAFQDRRAASLAGLLVEIGSDGVGAFLAEAKRLDPDVIAALRRRLRANR